MQDKPADLGSEGHRMLDGVVVDPLTEGFLRVARDPDARPQFAEALQVFFHDARNHLNSVKLDLYLAKRFATEQVGGIWPELDQCYAGLEHLFDRVQTLCRPAGRQPIFGELGDLLEVRRPNWEVCLGRGGRSLDWSPPEAEASGRVEPKGLIQGLDALIEWRASAGTPGEPGRLAWGLDRGTLWIEWSEALAPTQEPIEGREGRSVSMAFPLLARVMATLGGDLKVSNRAGLVVRMAWPSGEDEGESGDPA